MLRKTLDEISHNARVKIFPDGRREWLVADRKIFRESGWEEEKQTRVRSPKGECGESLERSRRRAKAQVRDIALCCRFSYFVTFTLDREKVDRYDIAEITRKLNTWLDNRVRRRGLVYVLVPELHKDGAVHFHGFINDVLPVVDSGKKTRRGQVIYNLPSWDFGFSTAVRINDDYERTVAYVCKYITKSTQKIGGRWYYSGGDIKRPEVLYFDMPMDEVPENSYLIHVPDAGFSMKIFRDS